ncbi:MAG: TolC family protein [Planctomycetia bacterium]|nr:TolC family protein [Planctomycetia bacterium]
MKRNMKPTGNLLLRKWGGMMFLAAALVTGGCNPQLPLFLGKHNETLPIEPYLDMATQIEFPDTETETIEEVKASQAPLTINNSKGKEIVDISLEEAIRCGLYNSTVVRNLGGISYGPNGASGSPSALTANPSGASTIYNPAITESDGRYGVEAVLADFDTQWSSTLYFQGNNSIENLASNGGLAPLRTKGGNFQTQLQKTNATGATWTTRFNADYIWSNSSTVAVDGYYNVGLETEFRQPLLRSAGVQFTRIAGLGAIPGFYNGVMIARLRTDMSLVDFETSIRNLVADIERAYWELYFAYRRLDSVVVGRDSALQTWRQAQAKYEAGIRGGSAQERAQAQQQYFLFKGSVESALNALYKAEANLRYIIGLTSADGRLFRPSDEPSVAKITFDWTEAHAEALSRNLELRRQKWVIKQSELELLASKNFLLPTLDLVGRGGVAGADETFLNPTGEADSAFGQMTHDGLWSGLIGAEFSVPIGFRREHSAVRNAELVLARNRALLQEQELEVTHKLGHAVRDLEDNYVLSQTYFNRRVAAQKEVEATTSAYETGTITLNIVLDAQRRLAEAEIDFFRSVIDYNLAIVDIHTQKGSLLEYDGVMLTEGPWASKAYFDAQKRAKMREKGHYLNYGFTRPNVISEGAYRQHTGMIDPANPNVQMQKMQQSGVIYGPQDNTVIPQAGDAAGVNLFPQGLPELESESGTSSILNTAPPQVPVEVIPTPPARKLQATTNRQTSSLAPTGEVPEEKSPKTYLKLSQR